MSKSLGNLVFVSDLLKTADPRAIRLALMRHHYRAGFEWYDTDLDEGTALLHRLLAAAERPTAPTRARSPSASAPRSTTTSTRRGARGARRPRERGPLRRRRRHRARRCCASSARCSASTSTPAARSCQRYRARRYRGADAMVPSTTP